MYDRFRGLIGDMLALPADDDKVRLCTHSIIAQVVHYAHARYANSLLWPELKMTPARVEKISNHIADFSLAYLRQETPPKPRGRARVRTLARKKT